MSPETEKNILVTTSNQYVNKALRPFAYCFHRYWSASQPVKVLGAKLPDYKLPDNFEFISVGDSWPKETYSDVVIEFLEKQTWEHFIWLMEDFWLSAPVNLRGIESLIDYMKQSPKPVIRMDLTLDRAMSGQVESVGGWRGFNLVETKPPSAYQMSLQPAIWTRTLLLEILIPSENPWQIELEGTSRLNKRDDYRILGTKENPFGYTNALNSTVPGINLKGLSKEIVAEMVEFGWLRLEDA